MALYIEAIKTDVCEIELYECECGLHIGIDSTYLEQVDESPDWKCYVCNKVIIINKTL